MNLLLDGLALYVAIEITVAASILRKIGWMIDIPRRTTNLFIALAATLWVFTVTDTARNLL